MNPNQGSMTAGVGGQITVNSDFTQATAGTINIVLGGTASNQFGTIAINGGATLAGTLNVTLANGYNPVNGDTLKVITFLSATGTFGTVNTPSLPGLVMSVKYDPQDVTLSVAPPPPRRLPGARQANTADAGLLPADTSPAASEQAALDQVFATGSIGEADPLLGSEPDLTASLDELFADLA
jgi:hypothetical protein